jgi:hypothetical protein
MLKDHEIVDQESSQLKKLLKWETRVEAIIDAKTCGLGTIFLNC